MLLPKMAILHLSSSSALKNGSQCFEKELMTWPYNKQELPVVLDYRLRESWRRVLHDQNNQQAYCGTLIKALDYKERK